MYSALVIQLLKEELNMNNPIHPSLSIDIARQKDQSLRQPVSQLKNIVKGKVHNYVQRDRGP